MILIITLFVGCRQPRPPSMWEMERTYQHRGDSSEFALTRAAINNQNATTEALVRQTQVQATLNHPLTLTATFITPTPTVDFERTATALIGKLTADASTLDAISPREATSFYQTRIAQPTNTPTLSAVLAAQLTATAIARLFTEIPSITPSPTIALSVTPSETPTWDPTNPTWTPTLIGFPDTATPTPTLSPTPTLNEDERNLRLSATAFVTEYRDIEATIGATAAVATSRFFQAQIPKLPPPTPSWDTLTPTPLNISEFGIEATANMIFQHDMNLTLTGVPATATPNIERTVRAQLTVFMRQTEAGPTKPVYLVPITFTPIPATSSR